MNTTQKPPFITIRVGHLNCESGIVMLTDPATVNEYWHHLHAKDIDLGRKFMVISTLKTIEYGKDFLHEQEFIDELGKTLEQAKKDGDVQEIMQNIDRNFNLRGAINMASRIDDGDPDWTMTNPENSMPGAAVIAAPQVGGGVYPVYAVMKYDSVEQKYHCVELKIQFQ